MSYSTAKRSAIQGRAVFVSHSDKRMDQMLLEGNKEKRQTLQACGQSCGTCSNRQKRGLGLYCKLKSKVIQAYNFCEKHSAAAAKPATA